MTAEQTVDARQGAAFVEGFADAWARPTPQRLAKLLHPDVVLKAPMTRTTHGLDEARSEFARLLDLLPDLRGEVHGWSTGGQYLYIDLTLSASAGGERFSWPLIDRFRIVDGLAIERVSYFDPSPIVRAALRHPSLWPGLVRSALDRLRSRH
jgi:hypothetical protein